MIRIAISGGLAESRDAACANELTKRVVTRSRDERYFTSFFILIVLLYSLLFLLFSRVCLSTVKLVPDQS